ncbi:hypothetical protein VSU01S_37210 [Vibrio superstes NBRC 103154]|uniref:Uncharacterized protein n=1 Tax=Vibrio superstes NBRC 103154 TaxID=1219062 RepID=A0A511QXL5_9VIBR|nr:hypothetical protein VSU01S_37210 [Vibrio superstes NBRC 103154]
MSELAVVTLGKIRVSELVVVTLGKTQVKELVAGTIGDKHLSALFGNIDLSSKPAVSKSPLAPIIGAKGIAL